MAGDIGTVERHRDEPYSKIPSFHSETHIQATLVFHIRRILRTTFAQAQTAPTWSHKDAPSSPSLRMAVVRDKPELKKQQHRAKEETEHAAQGRTVKSEKRDTNKTQERHHTK